MALVLILTNAVKGRIHVRMVPNVLTHWEPMNVYVQKDMVVILTMVVVQRRKDVVQRTVNVSQTKNVCSQVNAYAHPLSS
jgi:hypothetical protein